MLRLTVTLLHLNHLDRRRRLGGNIDWDKLHWNILWHLDHVWLLSDWHLDLDYFGWPSMVEVVMFMFVVVMVRKLNIGCFRKLSLQIMLHIKINICFGIYCNYINQKYVNQLQFQKKLFENKMH